MTNVLDVFLYLFVILLWFNIGYVGFEIWKLDKIGNKTKATERFFVELSIRPMKKFFILSGLFGFIYVLYNTKKSIT